MDTAYYAAPVFSHNWTSLDHSNDEVQSVCDGISECLHDYSVTGSISVANNTASMVRKLRKQFASYFGTATFLSSLPHTDKTFLCRLYRDAVRAARSRSGGRLN